MLNAAVLASTLTGILAGNGFVGSQLPQFCMGKATGLVLSTVGKAFTTTDVGTTPGPGVGTGVGLTGYLAPAALGAMLLEAAGKGFVLTPEVQDFYSAINDAYSTHLGLATLSSTHAPVAVGTGTVVPGSIPMPASITSPQLLAGGLSQGMLGDKYPDLCDIVAAGIEAGAAALTGTVTIVGSPVPPPAPGVGVGAGVVS